MYSVVLMAALTAGGTTAPAWHCGCGGGCWGCYGCGGCYGCHGCYGCYGGWTCYGGCYGGGCWGCYGCSGCWGYSYTSCCGCYGGSPYAVVYPAGVPEKPAEKVAPPKGGGDKPPAAEEKPKPGGGEAAAFRSARVVVELPADAKLFIDNQLTKPTSDRRTFNTPSLDHGQAYYYIARAEVTINGKTHTETKQVIVRAGETATARFSELLALTNPPAKPVASAETAKPVATAGR